MSKNRDIGKARYLAGEMSVQEEITFRNELEGNGNQLSDLKNMEKIWKYFDENPSGRELNTGKAWEKLHHRLEEDGLLEAQPDVRNSWNVMPALRIAASILILVAIGIPAIYFGFIKNNHNGAGINQISAAGTSTINLPDGSRVYLNEGARINYTPDFNRERAVELNGEAFFEVMSDPDSPFTVRSGKVVISVLGTSFNVKNLDRSPEVEVFVKTGKVRMALENSGQFITLVPGEVGHTDHQNLTRSVQKDPNYISWKTKDFKFVDAELKDVLRELEESYHVKIYPEKVELNGMKITTTYSEQSIDAILETIGTAFGLTVKHREDGYYLNN